MATTVPYRRRLPMHFRRTFLIAMWVAAPFLIPWAGISTLARGICKSFRNAWLDMRIEFSELMAYTRDVREVIRTCSKSLR